MFCLKQKVLYVVTYSKDRMKFAIIVSSKDIAGMNIKDSLLSSYKFINTGNQIHENSVYSLKNEGYIIKLYTINCDSIEFEQVTELIQADYYIFATKHQSKSKEKTLSTHFPGNFNDAEYGGKPGKLCMSCPELLKLAFCLLNNIGKESEYQITLEATHHGPLLKEPCMFIEIGSCVEQWCDKTAGDIISKTIISTIKLYKKSDFDIAIAFGGTHYCSGFNKIELNSNVALSHVCPKYHIENISSELVNEMIDSTKGSVSYALIDWKGLNGPQRTKLISVLDEINLPWKKTKQI